MVICRMRFCVWSGSPQLGVVLVSLLLNSGLKNGTDIMIKGILV